MLLRSEGSSTSGVTALLTASARGNTEIVKLLLEAKGDVNAKAHTEPKRSLGNSMRNSLKEHSCQWKVNIVGGLA